MTHAPARPGITSAPALPRAGRAALPALGAVRVVAVEPFRFPGTRVTVADVTLDVRGLRLRALVRAGHVVFGSLRGEPAVTFTAPGLEAEVLSVALDAAGEGGV